MSKKELFNLRIGNDVLTIGEETERINIDKFNSDIDKPNSCIDICEFLFKKVYISEDSFVLVSLNFDLCLIYDQEFHFLISSEDSIDIENNDDELDIVFFKNDGTIFINNEEHVFVENQGGHLELIPKIDDNFLPLTLELFDIERLNLDLILDGNVNEIEIFRYLIEYKGFNVNKIYNIEDCEQSVLFRVIDNIRTSKKSTEIAYYLIKMGADINFSNKYNSCLTLSFSLCFTHDNSKLIKFLLYSNADLTYIDNNGHTVLMNFILDFKKTDNDSYRWILNFLIERETNFDRMTVNGISLLHIIISRNKYSALELIIDKCRNIINVYNGKKTKQNCILLFLRDIQSTKHYNNQINILKLLLDNGADPNSRQYKDEIPDKTCLDLCEKMPEFYELLISYGADKKISINHYKNFWNTIYGNSEKEERFFNEGCNLDLFLITKPETITSKDAVIIYRRMHKCSLFNRLCLTLEYKPRINSTLTVLDTPDLAKFISSYI